MDMKMLLLLSLALVYISGVKSDVCTRYVLSGTNNYETIHGAYWHTGETCGSFYIWLHYDEFHDNFDYLYYKSSLQKWLIGGTECGTTAYLTAEDTSLETSIPSRLNWNEVDEDGDWNSAPSVSLKCQAAPTCNSYYVSGTKEHRVIHGTYVKTSGSCGALPVWRKYDNIHKEYDYLYYDVETGYWEVGVAECSEYIYIRAFDVTPETPSNSDLVWEETVDDEWVNVTSIKMVCYDGVRPITTTKQQTTTTSGYSDGNDNGNDNSNGNGDEVCTRLVLSGTINYKTINGAYWHTGETCGSFYIWMHYNEVHHTFFYLYYKPSFQKWLIGGTECGTTAYLTAEDTSLFLNTFIPSRLNWNEVNKDGDWNSAPSVSLKCQAAPTCSYYNVSGTQEHRVIHGDYVKTSGTCGALPVWRRYDDIRKEYDYLYYNVETGYWSVGDAECSEYSYIRAFDVTPESPSNSDLVWIETVDDEWVNVTSIKMVCYVAPTCSSYYVSGTKEHQVIHGKYGKTSGTCGGLPIWRRYDNTHDEYDYLFYKYETGHWSIGDAKCSEYSYITAFDVAPGSPSNSELVWEEAFDNFVKDDWEKVYTIKVVCYDGVQPRGSPGGYYSGGIKIGNDGTMMVKILTFIIITSLILI